MDVAAGGVACYADIADNLTLDNMPAGTYDIRAVVSIKSLRAIIMVNNNEIAVTSVPTA